MSSNNSNTPPLNTFCVDFQLNESDGLTEKVRVAHAAMWAARREYEANGCPNHKKQFFLHSLRDAEASTSALLYHYGLSDGYPHGRGEPTVEERLAGIEIKAKALYGELREALEFVDDNDNELNLLISNGADDLGCVIDGLRQRNEGGRT